MYSNKLKTFVNEIKEHNRNPLDTSVFEMLKETNSNPQNCIDAGQLFYRTRIITEKDSIGKSSDLRGLMLLEALFRHVINQKIFVLIIVTYLIYIELQQKN